MIIAKSGFSGFFYRLFDNQRASIGSLTWPTYAAVPRNGWAAGVVPSSLKDHTKIYLASQEYKIEYELLSDRAVLPNDLRFFLMKGEHTIVTADTNVLKKGLRWKIDIDGERYEFVKNGGIFSSFRFELFLKGQKIGKIVQTSGFTLWSRTFQIDMPAGIDQAAQVFLFFLAVNASFNLHSAVEKR